MKNKYAFIGTGNMAGAIIRGTDKTGVPHENIILCDKDKSKFLPFEGKGYNTTLSAGEAAGFADYIVLSVKPQNFTEPLSELRDNNVSLSDKVIVSIVAGISTARICGVLGRDTACVRTMPNTPLLIGRGVTALSRNSLVSDEDYEAVCGIFGATGRIIHLPEEKMNAIISVTSSSPAYVYLFIKSVADSAAAQGINLPDILDVVCDMVTGSAEMVKQSGKTPDELIRMVTSPGGTTERAMKVFNEEGFEKIIARAMEKCTERAAELSALNK